MITGVLCWFSAGTGQAQGTVISGVEVSSMLNGVDGWSFGQEGFSQDSGQMGAIEVFNCALLSAA